MTQYVINIGAIPNDGTGDPLRTAFNETNLNFDQVFAAGPVLSNIQIANNTILTTNVNGNLVLNPNGIGQVIANAHIVPDQTRIRNLGSPTQRWNTAYTQYATVYSDLSVGGNLTVQGNIIQVGNIVTDTLTIQLANAASTPSAANGAGITVGANDNIATILYNSTGNTWTTNIGLSSVGNITAPYFIGDGSQLTGLGATYGNSNVVAYGESGWAGNIIPSSNAIYSLGNSTNQWNDLYVSNTTIYMNNVPVSLGPGNVLTVNGNAVLQNDSNTSIATTGTITANVFATATSNLTIGPIDLVLPDPYTYIRQSTANGGLQVGWDGQPDNDGIAYITFNDPSEASITLWTGNANTIAHQWSFLNEGTFIGYGNIDFAGNAFLGNIETFNISAVGNVTGNYFIGDGSQLTGINAGSSNKIFNGNSYANIATANGNVEISANGNAWSFNTNGTTQFPGNVIQAPEGSPITVKATNGNAYTRFEAGADYAQIGLQDDTTGAYQSWAYLETDMANVNTPSATVILKPGDTGTEVRWTYNSDGSTIFPTLTTQRGDNPSGTITGQTLLFGDATQEAIISTPNGSNASGINSQRLVINPGKGEDSNGGEGGDIYLWAGRGGNNNGSGGDVKIRGGYAPADGTGGYIRIDGGASQANGAPGFIEITGGEGGNTTGGYVEITGGQGATVGGDVKMYGGYGTATGGNVNIWGGGSGNGQINEGHVNIQTGGNTWTFDAVGNLTLPDIANPSINYANGDPYGGSGGANTGNVTFSDQIVIGTGISNLVSGLYLAPSSSSANAEQYLRVRGDVTYEPTHIHFDTGNNQYFNQFIGDDNKYVLLSNTGNIVINTDDYAGNSAQWTFGVDGNLTVPGNILGGGNILIAPDSANSGGYLDIYLSTGPDVHIASNGDSNLILGRDDSSNVTVNTDGNVTIQANTSTPHVWKFDSSGNLNVPQGGYIGAAGVKGDGTMLTGGAGNVASLTSFYANGFYAGCFTANPDGNVNITTYTGNGIAGQWTFDATGNLTVPGGGAVWTLGTDTVGLTANIADPYQVNLGLDYTANTATLAGNSSVYIQTNSGANSWAFGNTGNTTFPNGAVFTGYDLYAAANSYVELAGSTGNTYMGVGNDGAFIQTDWNGAQRQWSFSETGNLTLPAGGNLIVSSGGIVGSNASPAPYLSGFSSVSAITLSASGNITGGNVLTGGYISATGNITGANLFTSGNIVTAGSGGDIAMSGGDLTGAGNIYANYFVGNVVGTTVSTTGNVYAGNVIINGQSTTYGVVTPAYMVVGLVTSVSGFSNGSTFILDTVVSNTNSQTSYNASTGVFTLTAGVTYDMSFTPSFITFSNTTGGFFCYDWVDATSNVQLDTTGIGTGTSISSQDITAQQDNATARVIYTPTTNQTVKLRVTNANGTVTLRGGIGTQAIIKPLNPTIAVQATSFGNVSASGYVSAAGNVTGGNVLTSGIVSATGTITSSGNISATGNVTAANFVGNLVYTPTYGSFYDTTTQTNGNVGNAIPISYNTTNINNGVTIAGAGNTQITIAETGIYNIQFSLQVRKTDSGADTVYVWLDKNGASVANTATALFLTGSGAAEVAAWNFVVSATANDYYRLMWMSTDSHVEIVAVTAGAVVPAIPSVILTVVPVGA